MYLMQGVCVVGVPLVSLEVV
ncbi:hypothetical protein OIU74_009315 [Salix koriyanagi]|uniref:Uncharacterized protein n=1 Tax=Salix koriyanagi TaxID=2511006 RepID=A0A9Q0Z0C5_9ROSI|nr:hypothetical protein OIU74_009315 [Salix koriyanagi]